MAVMEDLRHGNHSTERQGKTYSVDSLNERVVDSDDLNVGVFDSVAEDDTADTTETVDADLDGSHSDL